MGSFFGHALPGTFFILFASWWCVQVFRRFYQSLQTRTGSGPFLSSVTFPIRTRRGWVDIEAYFTVIAVALGMFVELVCAPIKNGKLYMGNVQHGTMYFFFGMTSLFALVLRRIKVISDPDGLVYICLFMAYTAEGLLFKFHLFGREGLDVQLHTLLVYTIFASSLITLFEYKYRNNVLLPLSRAFLTCLQGTWFWQAAFILYPPFSDPWGSNSGHGHHESATEEPHEKHDHNLLMFVTCVYTWHAAVIFLVMLVVGIVIGKYYQRHGGIDEVALQRGTSGDHGQNGYAVLDTRTDDI